MREPGSRSLHRKGPSDGGKHRDLAPRHIRVRGKTLIGHTVLHVYVCVYICVSYVLSGAAAAAAVGGGWGISEIIIQASGPLRRQADAQKSEPTSPEQNL